MSPKYNQHSQGLFFLDIRRQKRANANRNEKKQKIRFVCEQTQINSEDERSEN